LDPLNIWVVGSNGAILKNTPPGEFGITPATLPRVISEAANYPNPFNPATTISFTLLEPTGVTITIYDVVGRKVATLLDDEPLEAGPQSFRFDTRDVHGKDLSSGVYLYRIATRNGFADETRKMILLK